MVGFVIGAYRETQTGEPLLLQALRLSPWDGFWLLVIVVASLQPITRAAKSEPFGASFGLLQSDLLSDGCRDLVGTMEACPLRHCTTR